MQVALRLLLSGVLPNEDGPTKRLSLEEARLELLIALCVKYVLVA